MSKSTGEKIFGVIATIAGILGYSYYQKNKKSKK